MIPTFLRFKEAIAWFRRRVPLPKPEWLKLEARAARHAFTVAGVAELDLVSDAMAALAKALKDGEDLADFKRRVSAKLEREWGGPRPRRVETIFRTNMQTAYAAGRWKQMQDPTVLRAQPYGMISVVLDKSTSAICRAWGTIVLPLADPWWRTHWPPYHFNCRTTVIGLRESVARAMGVSAHPPKVEPDEGFGLAPVAGEWAPGLTGYPKPLVQAFRRKYKGT